MNSKIILLCFLVGTIHAPTLQNESFAYPTNAVDQATDVQPTEKDPRPVCCHWLAKICNVRNNRCKFAHSLPPSLSDPDQLTQVFLNGDIDNNNSRNYAQTILSALRNPQDECGLQLDLYIPEAALNVLRNKLNDINEQDLVTPQILTLLQ